MQSETAFIALLRAGDEGAFATLVDTHHAALLRVARMFVASHAVAEEVVQDTWLAVLSGLDSFEGRSSLKTWIFRILANRARTRGAREARSLPFSALGEPGSPAVDPTRFKADGMWAAPPQPWSDETPETLVLQNAALEKLRDAIAALPPNQQAVVSLRDVIGLDSSEVCNMLDISETNQRVLLHRARSALRAVLEDYVDQGRK